MAYEVKETGRNKFDVVHDGDNLTITKIPSGLSQEARSAYYANSVLNFLNGWEDVYVTVAPEPKDYDADFVGCVVINDLGNNPIDSVLNTVAMELNVDISNVKGYTVKNTGRFTFDAHSKADESVVEVSSVDDAIKKAMEVMLQLLSK